MLVGNKKNQKYLDGIVVNGNFGHGYLFVGPGNVGKTSFAVNFAKAILCQSDAKPCNKCEQCLLFEAGNHPDFMLYDDDASLGVDEIRSLIGFLELKPYQASNKVAVISHAEKMTPAAANSFLKTLEEPSEHTVIILTVENMHNLLPTVLSRLQAIKFSLPSDEEIRVLFPKMPEAELNKLLALSSSRAGLALSLNEEKEMFEKYQGLAENFLQAIYRGTISQRLKFAEGLAKEKNSIGRLLDVFESVIRNDMLVGEGGRLKYLNILDKLSEARELLSKNVNSQMVLESLLLTGVGK